MQATGKIQSTILSQSGKSISVHVDGTKYSCKMFDIQQVPIGSTITYDTTDSEYNGKAVHWINEFKVDHEAPAQNTPPQSNNNAPNNNNISNLPMAFISNTVANAVQSQAITKPNEINAWVDACVTAINNAETKRNDQPYK